jgi:hypothetical protein
MMGELNEWQGFWLSALFMVIAILFINFFFLAQTPLKYFGLIGFGMIGAFWNKRVL